MASRLPAQLRKVVTLLFAALAVIVLMVFIVGWSAQRSEENLNWDEHTYQVLYELENTLVQTLSIQSGARAFALTGQDQSLTPYESGLIGVQQSLARLKTLVADNVEQDRRAAQLSRLVEEEIAVMRERLAARRRGGLDAAAASASDGRGRKIMQQIRDLVGSMERAERHLLALRSGAARADDWWTLLIVSVGGLLAGMIIVLAIRGVRRTPVPPTPGKAA